MSGLQDTTFEPPIDLQIQEVERQIHFLSTYTLPSQVGARRTTQREADQTLRNLRAAAANLRGIRDGKLAVAQ
jgi:hypothetical protein